MTAGPEMKRPPAAFGHPSCSLKTHRCTCVDPARADRNSAPGPRIMPESPPARPLATGMNDWHRLFHKRITSNPPTPSFVCTLPALSTLTPGCGQTGHPGRHSGCHSVPFGELARQGRPALAAQRTLLNKRDTEEMKQNWRFRIHRVFPEFSGGSKPVLTTG